MILFGGGIHFVWALYHVYNYYSKEGKDESGEVKNAFKERFIIWSWYIGAIIGSCVSGAIIPRFTKRLIYVSILSFHTVINLLYYTNKSILFFFFRSNLEPVCLPAVEY